MSEQQQPEQDWAREAEGRICDEIARVLGGRDAGMAKANIDIAALTREAQPFDPTTCGLVDKCPDNPLCAMGCEHYVKCYPNSRAAQEQDAAACTCRGDYPWHDSDCPQPDPRTTTLLLSAERDWAKANIAQAKGEGVRWNEGYLYAIEKLIKCLPLAPAFTREDVEKCHRFSAALDSRGFRALALQSCALAAKIEQAAEGEG